MKRRLPRFFIYLAFIFLLGCAQEDQPMEAAQVYFPLASRADADGVYQAALDYDRDTVMCVAVYCSGSIFPQSDVQITLQSALDSLNRAAATNANLTAYEVLPPSAYTLSEESLTLTIPKGKDRADLLVTVRGAALQAGKQYILPLTIATVSPYEVASQYECLFLGITEQ